MVNHIQRLDFTFHLADDEPVIGSVGGWIRLDET